MIRHTCIDYIYISCLGWYNDLNSHKCHINKKNHKIKLSINNEILYWLVGFLVGKLHGI